MVNPCDSERNDGGTIQTQYGPSWSLPGDSSFLAEMADFILSREADGPVVRLASPQTISSALSKSVGLSLKEESGHDLPSMMEAVKTVDHYNVRSAHPFFLNQLYGRADPVSTSADMFAAACNSQVFTFEVSPVFTLVEVEVIKKLASYTYPEGGDGLFTPGGSIANLYSMQVARYKKFPQIRTEGLHGLPKMVVFCTSHVHYSYQKSAMVLGLGMSGIVTVKSGPDGAMDPEDLEEQIKASLARGEAPFMIGAVCGSTVMGAYDPLRPLAAIAKKYDLWLHADGCWGGAVVLSENQRHRMDGIELTDSWSLSCHKMMGIVTQCACFITKHKGLTNECNSYKASYLFQAEKLNSDLDIGDMTIQCGRRPDAFKVWLAWKAIGDAGFAARVDRTFEVAALMKKQVEEEHDGCFLMALPQVGPATCFWYIPKWLRGKPEAEWTDEDIARLAKVAPAIKQRLQETGGAMIGFQPLMGKCNFFRAVFPSAAHISDEDITGIMRQVAAAGEYLGFNE